jgi:hypothetical protein
MIIKIILIITALIMVGCSVFPSNTSISATSKVGEADEATIKVQQDFKWRQ